MPEQKLPALPTWADPKQNSVFSPLYQQLIRKAVSTMGYDDPMSAATSVMNPMATPLVSIYPNKLARQRGTEIFGGMARALPSRLRSALEEFGQKYPRIAAHMRPKSVPTHRTGAGTSSAYAETKMGHVIDPVEVGFTPEGRAKTEGPLSYDEGMKKARDYVSHEGTHVAQALGNADFNNLYNHADNLYGYTWNPFERTAIEAGTAAGSGLKPGKAKLGLPNNNAIQLLRRDGNKYLSEIPAEKPAYPHTGSRDHAAEYIQRILEERRGEGWKPTSGYVPEEVPDWWTKRKGTE